MDYVDEIFSIIDELPPLPDNIIKLKDLLSSDSVNYHQISPLIEKDPGLTAEVLRIANSPFYGFSHRIESIDVSVSVLGLKNIVDLVTISFANRVIKQDFSEIAGLDEYFKHSQMISLASKLIAKELSLSSQEQSFYTTVGILHDIGRLIIILFSERESLKELGGHWDNINEIEKVEHEVLGIEHPIIGEKIAEKWGFSNRIAKAIEFHHTPFNNEPNIDSAYILLAHFLIMPEMNAELLATVFDEDMLKLMNISATKLIELKKKFNNFSL